MSLVIVVLWIMVVQFYYRQRIQKTNVKFAEREESKCNDFLRGKLLELGKTIFVIDNYNYYETKYQRQTFALRALLHQ